MIDGAEENFAYEKLDPTPPVHVNDNGDISASKAMRELRIGFWKGWEHMKHAMHQISGVIAQARRELVDGAREGREQIRGKAHEIDVAAKEKVRRVVDEVKKETNDIKNDIRAWEEKPEQHVTTEYLDINHIHEPLLGAEDANMIPTFTESNSKNVFIEQPDLIHLEVE